MSQVPKTIHLSDYKVPSHLIPQVDLTFDLAEDETFVTTTMKVEANPKSDLNKQELFLDGEQLELVSIERDGETLPPELYTTTDTGLLIKGCPDNFELTTKVRLLPQNNKAFSGLYKTKNIFCTQMEAQGFRRTTYFLDRPDVLSKYTTTINADKNKYPILLSNGNPTSEKDLDNGRHQSVWQDPFPKPSYLFALVAGDLEWIEDSFLTRSKRRVDLKIFVDKGKKDRARYAMNALKQAMTWDEETYRLEYDLDIYNIVAVDDFNMGAMENKGLNIFNSKYVLASPQTATDDEYQGIQRVIGHEYFHNWTGNRVTCRDWFQLSLKEGLTVFRDQEFSADMNSRGVKRIEDVTALRSRQFPEDAGPMAHPVRPSSYIAIDNFYTVTVYEKGAEVIRMLESLIGKEMFQKGVTKYFELYDGQAVTTDDWIHSMEVVTGRDLTQFKNWYDQAGTPTVRVQSEYDAENQSLKLHFQQETPDPITGSDQKPFHIPLEIGLLSASGVSLDFAIADQERQDLIELTKNSQTVTLQNVYEKPIVSINRGFTAPIKLQFEQSDSELNLMMTKDSDSFNRWEAGQRLYRQNLLEVYSSLKNKQDLPNLDDIAQSMANLLSNALEDPALTACLISQPKPLYLAQFIEGTDPKTLDQAYLNFGATIAEKLHDPIHELYQNLQERELGLNQQDSALRTLKNVLLSYLYRNNSGAGDEIFAKHYDTAKNMTDRLAAMQRLSVHGGDTYQRVMSDFEKEWQDDALVMNKWLIVKALAKHSNAFEDIKATTEGDNYDHTNPNNVFSLLYHWGKFNGSSFHNTDGTTYDWFAEQTIKIDKLNPQVSARLGSCFTPWKSLDKQYQPAIEASLKKIKDSDPSSNLFEIVDRALKN